MEKRELTCISCPMGCQMTVLMDDESIRVTGNACKRGEVYARKEVTNPRRVVTSTVKVNGGEFARVSVKTETDVPFYSHNMPLPLSLPHYLYKKLVMDEKFQIHVFHILASS